MNVDSTLPSPGGSGWTPGGRWRTLLRRMQAREWGTAGVLYALIALINDFENLVRGAVPLDERLMHLPSLALNWEQVRAGILPLWNPHMWGGLPLLGSHYAASLYPAGYAFIALMDPFRAFATMQAAHYVWLGLGIWGWLRWGWGLRPGAALMGGAFGMLSGFAMAHEGHSPMLWTLAWMPWVLWQGRRCADGRRWGMALLAGCVAVQVSAGYMHMAVLTWMGLGLEALVRNGVAARRAAGGWARLGWAMVLGVGLMAVQLMTTRETLPMTYRGRLDFETFAGPGVAAAEWARFVFPLLFGAVTPSRWVDSTYFGSWEWAETTGAMGMAAMMGVLMWLTTRRGERTGGRAHGRRGRRMQWLWFGIGVAAAVQLLGEGSPLARVLYHVPVYNLFRLQVRWLVFLDVAVAVLAAVGLDRVVRRAEQGERSGVGVAFGLGAAAVLLAVPATWVWLIFTYRAQMHGVTGRWFLMVWFTPGNAAVWVPLLAGVAAVGAVGWMWRRPRAIGGALGLLLAVHVCEQSFLGEHLSREGIAAERAMGPGNETVAKLREWNPEGSAPYRVMPVGTADSQLTEETLAQQLAQLNGIDNVLGNWPLMVPAQGALVSATSWGGNIDPWGMLVRPWLGSMTNVKYYLFGYGREGDEFHEYRPEVDEPSLLKAIRQRPEAFPDLRIVHTTARGATIVENLGVLPRAWMVRAPFGVYSPDEAVERLWDSIDFDPRQTVLIELPEGQKASMPTWGEGTVREVKRLPDRLWLEAQAPESGGMVVISDAWYPGWWARVNGELVEIERVNGVMRGIQVPPGRSEIYLRYLPDGFKQGAVVSLMFAMAWLVTAGAEWRWGRMRRWGG